MQISKGICVGQASRLTQSDIRPQARRPRYISEVGTQTAFAMRPANEILRRSRSPFVKIRSIRGLKNHCSQITPDTDVSLVADFQKHLCRSGVSPDTERQTPASQTPALHFRGRNASGFCYETGQRNSPAKPLPIRENSFYSWFKKPLLTDHS